MSITTYDELKAAVARWLKDDSLSEYIPDFITLAEARHRREIRCQGNEGRWRTSVAIDTGSRYLGLPDDYIGGRMVRFLSEETGLVVGVPKITSPDQLSQRLRYGEGVPQWFTIHSDFEFDIIPTPGMYRAEILYFRAFPKLSTLRPTNWLLENAPDLYLYGALTDSAPFIREDERILIWKSLYEEKRNDLNEQYQTGLYSMGTVA